MKNLGEKEKKKNEIDSIDNILNNMSIIEKMADEMMKILYFVIFYLMLLVIIVLFFVSIDALSDIVL